MPRLAAGRARVKYRLLIAVDVLDFTATLTRRISKNLRLNLKYAYSHYVDSASGGNFSYNAHLIYSSLQYRF